MCRATTSASTRRNRRTVLPVALEDLRQAVEGVTLKGRPQDEEVERPPRLVPVGSDSESDRCSDSSDRRRRQRQQPQQCRRRNPCPVTGRPSNVLDDYVVFPRVLGEGHYGCVRECLRRDTRETYACKSIDKSKIGRLDHLRREVQLLSRVDHDGIMRMVDCYEDADYVHIVTEKYTGGELFDKVVSDTTDDGCFSEERAAPIVKSLLEAVAYLHSKDIVHRDIKPENVLFESRRSDSAVRLIDFGLSRRHGKGEAPMSNPVGTAYYMAPELLMGKYDQACDVWSVGTIAYILLCGYPPFNGDEDPEIFEAIKKGKFDFPERQWGNVSAEAKDLIKCLLRRDPRKRFTAEEALMHPWIANAGAEKVQRKTRSLRNLKI
ncbi:hypothetical protein ACHAWF_007049 [Thalassiosira exigua]